jgi:hypothetical protein
MRRIAMPLFSLLFAASLILGVGAALAQPAMASSCPYDPTIGQIGLSCSVHSECTRPCQRAYPGSPGGTCSFGCCVCAY